MAADDHGPTIKDDEQYEALREQGASKEKAARIANSDSHETGEKGGHLSLIHISEPTRPY